MKSSRPAEDLFKEAQHNVCIRNVKINDITRYAWKIDKNAEINEDEALFGKIFAEERVEAAVGICIEGFGFYANEVEIEDAWFCPIRGRGMMIVSSRNPGFIRTMFWKAAMARDRVYSLCIYVPQAAKDRFDEIERRLRSIRSTQPNLRTQVRLGENDFDIRCKYINTGGKEIYEKYPLDKLDPEETLPPILCKGAKIPLATQRYLIKANEKLNDAEKKELLKKSEEPKEGETDEDGFRTEKMRKARSPA